MATASTNDAPVAVLEDDERRIWGVQFHPEVVHTPHGMTVLRTFLHDLAGCDPTWRMSSVVEEQVARIRAQIGDARAICALSGGVDSSVAAALVHRAIGHQLTCVYVDTGLMRKDESAQIVETYRRTMGLELIHVDGRRPLLRGAPGHHRSGGEAQGDRRAVRAHLRGEHRRADRGRVPRAGHAVPRPDRERRCRRHGRRDQEPPQRRRAPRRHDARARRAAPRPVQGRGPPARYRARPARRVGVAPTVPGSGARGADHR